MTPSTRFGPVRRGDQGRRGAGARAEGDHRQIRGAGVVGEPVDRARSADGREGRYRSGTRPRAPVDPGPPPRR